MSVNAIIRFIILLLLYVTVTHAAQPVDMIVKDERVFANIESITYYELLSQLSDAASIKISLIGTLPGKTALVSNGRPLTKVVKDLLPNGSGFIFSHHPDQHIKSLTVLGMFGTGKNTSTVFGMEQQKYLERQIGREDQGTIDIISQVLISESTYPLPVKLTAINMLRDIASDQAVTALEYGLNDSDPLIRVASVKTIYALKGDEKIVRLAESFFAEKSPQIQIEIAAILQQSNHAVVQGITKFIQTNE